MTSDGGMEEEILDIWQVMEGWKKRYSTYDKWWRDGRRDTRHMTSDGGMEEEILDIWQVMEGWKKRYSTYDKWWREGKETRLDPTYDKSSHLYLQVHLNKLECRGKFIYFSNSTQIVKLVYLTFFIFIYLYSCCSPYKLVCHYKICLLFFPWFLY